MYAKLSYVKSTGWGITTILADMVSVLTGTTDINLLSATLNKPSSSITTSAAVAGWTLHDNAAAVNAKVLKSPVADDPTKFKYLYIQAISGFSMVMKMYESWDAVTHVGANVALSDGFTTGASIVGVSSGNDSVSTVVHLSSSARHFTTSSHYPDLSASSVRVHGMFEYDRVSAWDTVANGYLPVVQTHTQYGFESTNTLEAGSSVAAFASCRFLTNATPLADVTGTSATMGIKTAYGSVFPLAWSLGSSTSSYRLSDMIGGTLDNSQPYNEIKVKTMALYPFSAVRPDHKHAGGNISGLSGVFFTTYNMQRPFVELLVGSTTYVIWQAGTHRLAIRKG